MKTRRISRVFSVVILALLLSACSFSGGRTGIPAASQSPSDSGPAAPSSALEEALPESLPPESALRIAEHPGGSSGEYIDSLGNSCRYFYSMPLVNGGTDYADAVNAELESIYNTYLLPDLRNMEAGHSLVTNYVTWRAAEYKGITSLLVCMSNTWGNQSFFVYHFTAEGEQATNADLFSVLGISGEEFSSKAYAAMGSFLGPEREDIQSEEIRAAIEESRRKTLSPENCSAELPLFVTARGTVCFVGRIFSPAGPGYHDHLFIIPPREGFQSEELAELARDYYGLHFTERPEAAVSNALEDGSVRISVYRSKADTASLCEIYTLSPLDGSGVDSGNKAVRLTVQ